MEIIRIHHGKLQGDEKYTIGGKEYLSFTGIPYALPPVGRFRFKDPIPMREWKGILDATIDVNRAPQMFNDTEPVYSGTDDCLYLNVYTPFVKKFSGAKEPEKLLPVMVKIHGGGFQTGSSSAQAFGPDFFIENDVVLVVINFRLGVMGFLCTDPKFATGDMGLKDQSMALKWVQQNIEVFGGDPNNVTLFGCSSGAASVEFHLLSPKSRGLFHKAIMQSGSIMNPWAIIRNPLERAQEFADALGYNIFSDKPLFEYINSFSTEHLVKCSFDPMDKKDLKNGSFCRFGPCVNVFEEYDGFLTRDPVEILDRGDFHRVPVISGFCENEGAIMREYISNESGRLNLPLEELIDYIPDFINHDIPDLADRLKNVYTGEDGVNKFLSDMGFIGGILHSLRKRLLFHREEYLYKFSYVGNLNLMNQEGEINGACHGDELGYMTNCKFVDQRLATDKDILVRKRLMKMWTDFAKTGDPTPEINELITEKWYPTSSLRMGYMEIGEELKFKRETYSARNELWRQIYKKL